MTSETRTDYADLRKAMEAASERGVSLTSVDPQAVLAFLDDNKALRKALEVAREALDGFAGEANRFHIGASENYRYKPDKHSRLSTASFYLARDAMPIIDAALGGAQS